MISFSFAIKFALNQNGLLLKIKYIFFAVFYSIKSGSTSNKFDEPVKTGQVSDDVYPLM